MSVIVPILYVEGKDDISVINALLLRHGLDTGRGERHIRIKDEGSDTSVLDAIPEAIKVSTDRPVGFVIDIDIRIAGRWSSVKQKVREAGGDPPKACPAEGYIDKLPNYPQPFGVWLMPDCASDNAKLENLIESLIPNNVLWPNARAVTKEAARLADQAGFRRFKDVDSLKAEIFTWLAWQDEPGMPAGAAINSHVLGFDSPQARSFLRWLKNLYSLPNLDDIQA